MPFAEDEHTPMRRVPLSLLLIAGIALLSVTAVLWLRPARVAVQSPPDAGDPRVPVGDTFRVAAIQAPSVMGDPDANRQHLAALVERAAAMGAQVVVLPETAVSGYASWDLKTTWQVEGRPISEGLAGRDPRAVAEAVPGESTRFFAALARKRRVYLTVPLLECDRKTHRYFNTVVLLGPDGLLLRHYRKRNPWPWAEQSWATPGDLGNSVIDTPFGRFAMLICYDIHEQTKILAEQKVDTLLYSIAWVDDPRSDWFIDRLPAVAARHNLNIVGANWSVPEGYTADWSGYGRSLVINKLGRVLARAVTDHGDEIVIATLPTER